MNAVVTVNNLVKRYGSVTAVDQVNFSLQENRIYGLLGRNGAGKTTLMHMITSQLFPTEGEVKVFGEQPYENYDVLRKVCFIKESQAYIKNLSIQQTLRLASDLYPNWDHAYAEQLVKLFQLPPRRKIKKLSRGMLSSVGIIIGLASRAPLTIFDEPYLGLDAASRNLFYEQLLRDYSEYPRTVILSTHLIDEVSKLFDQVLIINQGKVIINEEAENLRTKAYTISGPLERINHYSVGRQVLHREELAGVAAITIWGELDSEVHQEASQLGLTVEPVSLQKLMIHLTAMSNSDLS